MENNTEIKRYNAIINNAWQLVARLSKMRKEAQQLAEKCRAFDVKNDSNYFEALAQVAEDLSAFDLEDAIPEEMEENA